jgi:hypothetical protein
MSLEMLDVSEKFHVSKTELLNLNIGAFGHYEPKLTL